MFGVVTPAQNKREARKVKEPKKPMTAVFKLGAPRMVPMEEALVVEKVVI